MTCKRIRVYSYSVMERIGVDSPALTAQAAVLQD